MPKPKRMYKFKKKKLIEQIKKAKNGRHHDDHLPKRHILLDLCILRYKYN